MTGKQYAGAMGFAFVAAWIGFGFGDAILCLIGAVIFYAVMAFREGEIDLAELQGRFGQQGRFSQQGPTPPAPKAGRRVE